MTKTDEIIALLRRQTQVMGEIAELLKAQFAAREAERVPLPRDFKLVVVFAQYPGFQRDYAWLTANGYIAETPDGLVWNKSKQCLAEYFGNQASTQKKRRWRDVENLFNVKDLRNSLSRNGDLFKKPSLDYEELLTRLAGPVKPVPKTPPTRECK
jgi:hypothetical protein